MFLVKISSTCAIGDRCNSHTKAIGLTLDDILRYEILSKTSFKNQKLIVKISAAVTMIMFAGGLVSSILSLITFQNKELRKVGCGIYLLASSITSLLTMCIFTVKFWFVILTQINTTSVSLSTFQGGCKIIEPLLKLFLYVDSWLNACVAIERNVNIFKGVTFDKKKSKRTARLIIIILPIFVMGTIIHEPIYRDLFEYKTEKYKPIEYELMKNLSMQNKTEEYEIETYVFCITRYSHFIQNYNTAVLFFHLVVPFIANLYSALYIIFASTRRRSTAQTKQIYKEHFLEQLNEHKQLLISPVILLILSLPRLIISLIPGCVNASDNPWLYLCGYFISFIPSMLIFLVFVLPSDLYKKTFKETIQSCRRHILQ